MSTRATILLSDDNEHWYEDCSDNTINLEIEKKHLHSKPDRYDDSYLFVIKEGTALHKAISELLGGNR